MFSRILIANRGEIAHRIIRACRELSVESVAVYSDVDASAPWVRAADHAIAIGPAPAAQSYLNAERLLDAARVSGAEAVHPGYGFLSERSSFARQVIDAGLAWIGPPPDAIAAMGDKTAARKLVRRAGVPVVPGSDSAVTGADDAIQAARRFGFPVMLKASAGGGGRGMRIVREPGEMPGALAAAAREALAAFGDGAVYVEKYIEGPRHVEMQVLADRHGTTISLGERECSLQRRHQKMVEEAPSPAITPALRRRMGETAVAAARAAGYVNAGTVEFLLDRNDAFYFLEMNTRLQVEHPVTELVTGVDLAQWQIRIAAGERLTVPPGIEPRGWAIECRLTSEDSEHGFVPSSGRISWLRVPAGPGVRWDGAIETGSDVTLFYDSLLGKLITWGSTRDLAVRRMRRALRELRIVGVETSRELHLRILDDPEFIAARFDIQWLESRLPSLLAAEAPETEVVAAAVGAALRACADRGAAVTDAGNGSGSPRSLWHDAARRDGLR